MSVGAVVVPLETASRNFYTPNGCCTHTNVASKGVRRCCIVALDVIKAIDLVASSG